METDPRGYMMIISNKVFQHMSQRLGSDRDVTELESVFTSIGYDVDVHHNLTSEVVYKLKYSKTWLEGSSSFATKLVVQGKGSL